MDHDHETGETRGMLCSACNKMLGFARDDPEILRRALEYLHFWDVTVNEIAGTAPKKRAKALGLSDLIPEGW